MEIPRKTLSARGKTLEDLDYEYLWDDFMTYVEVIAEAPRDKDESEEHFRADQRCYSEVYEKMKQVKEKFEKQGY